MGCISPALESGLSYLTLCGYSVSQNVSTYNLNRDGLGKLWVRLFLFKILRWTNQETLLQKRINMKRVPAHPPAVDPWGVSMYIHCDQRGHPKFRTQITSYYLKSLHYEVVWSAKLICITILLISITLLKSWMIHDLQVLWTSYFRLNIQLHSEESFERNILDSFRSCLVKAGLWTYLWGVFWTLDWWTRPGQATVSGLWFWDAWER